MTIRMKWKHVRKCSDKKKQDKEKKNQQEQEKTRALTIKTLIVTVLSMPRNVNC